MGGEQRPEGRIKAAWSKGREGKEREGAETGERHHRWTPTREGMKDGQWWERGMRMNFS